ncbi:MAG: hypothetical protein QNK05_08665 [Myxococcota bacterium]|nr:hypothetical protein [Myxococcota bacterium]
MVGEVGASRPDEREDEKLSCIPCFAETRARESDRRQIASREQEREHEIGRLANARRGSARNRLADLGGDDALELSVDAEKELSGLGLSARPHVQLGQERICLVIREISEEQEVEEGTEAIVVAQALEPISQGLLVPAEQAFDGSLDQGLAASEIVEDQMAIHPGCLGDICERGGIQSRLGNRRLEGVENLAASERREALSSHGPMIDLLAEG